MLHFSIFCVFICEGCETLPFNAYNYGEGWDTLAKKAVYTPWEGKLKDYAKFWPQKGNTYGRGPDTFGNFA